MWTAIDPEQGTSVYIQYCDTEAEAREMLAAAKEELLRDIHHDLFGREAREALREAHKKFKTYRIVELTEEQRRRDFGESPES